MIISILSRLGHYNAAKRYLNFILEVIPYKDETIQIMYGINGAKKLSEKKLDFLSGYLNSKPVRVGNAAYLQKQNDIYGVLMDVILQNVILFKSDLDNSEGLWTVVRTLVRNVENHWEKPDRGVWEYRSKKEHFVFLKPNSAQAVLWGTSHKNRTSRPLPQKFFYKGRLHIKKHL